MSRRNAAAIFSIGTVAVIVALIATIPPRRSPLFPIGSPGAPTATSGVETSTPKNRLTVSERGSFDGSVANLTFQRPPKRAPREEREYKREPRRVDRQPPAPVVPALRQADTPLLSFEALDAVSYSNHTPPDPHGDVGPNHYIASVNTAVAIFAKSNGALLADFSFDQFMTAAGMSGACGTDSMGDPYIIYDRVSGRWLISDMAWIGNSGPYFECIAVSKTANPVTGGWWTYAFQISGNYLGDYPKFGAWADGIYMTTNLFGNDYGGVEVDVFNRADLISNASPLRTQTKLLSASNYSLLPVNDEFGEATVGSPALFVSDANGLQMWKWAIDWTNEANSVWSGPFSVGGGDGYNWAPEYIVQRGSTERLDSLFDRLMSGAQWSNVDGTPAVWIARSIDAGSGRAGIYWAEIRGLSGSSPTVYQDMQYVVANSNRWLPTLAVNKRGAMGIGFSVADGSTYPSFAYAGRTASAALGTLDLGERIIASGASPAVSGYRRWGDYFSASLDPSDDCSVWLMGEYMSSTGGWDWTTRVAKVRIGNCADAPVNSAAPTIADDPTAGVAVSAESGDWSGDPTYSYAWYLCTDSGAAAASMPTDCSAIRNATSSSFTPTIAQVGRRLRVQVTATNDAAAISHVSAATNVIRRIPAASAAPAVSGTTRFGSTLSATTGTWIATPAAEYSYRWIRCTSTGRAASAIPGGCVTIDVDATNATYVPVEDDIGKYLRIRVTASNSAGSTLSFSSTTQIIKGLVPASTGAPTVSGTAQVGQVLSATSGTWSGTPSPAGSYRYAWFACTVSGAASSSPRNCSAIRNATGSTFTVTRVQLGKLLRVRVTASNSAGSAQFYSATTGAIAP